MYDLYIPIPALRFTPLMLLATDLDRFIKSEREPYDVYP